MQRHSTDLASNDRSAWSSLHLGHNRPAGGCAHARDAPSDADASTPARVSDGAHGVHPARAGFHVKGPRDSEELERTLLRIDGRGYKAYKQLRGPWRFEGFTLQVDHVQGDPFAAPTRLRAILTDAEAGLPPSTYHSRIRALGTAACLARSFAGRARSASRRRGTGKSGTMEMESPGQEVLAQTALLISEGGAVEARFGAGLPARGRTVVAREAIALLLDDIPALVSATLASGAHDPQDLEQHADTNEDAEYLRGRLREMGLVAFVADGAHLPRRSGVDDRPLEGPGVVAFRSPESLRASIELPNSGAVTGMGVPEGITLVAGGGFHGKSTLLSAIETGVYNHRPGDGRERVVSRACTVKVRAEDGRSVNGVDISGFIDGLPLGRATRSFTTPNASGSTSQAACIVEALEAGAEVLLVDEDTSATNFMIRDRRMQALVPRSSEPITPFVDRIRELRATAGVSCLLVLGGSGDYLDVADTVLAMHTYEPADVTARARSVAEAHPTGRASEAGSPLSSPAARVPVSGSVDPGRGRRAVYVRVPDSRTLLFGTETVDLAAVEQLVSRAQVRSVGLALSHAAAHLIDGVRSVAEILDAVEEAVARDGLDALDPRHSGDLAEFRRFELAAALNRLRSLRVE